MKKIFFFTLIIMIPFFSACSLIYDQSKDKNAESSQANTEPGFDLSVYEQNKNYESNRIISSDFPVTYRAKPLSTF